MTRSIRMVLLTVLALAAPAAFAHGGREHVMGTVQSVDGAHLVVKTTAGATETIDLDASTVYRDAGGATATGDAVRPGDRVVVDVAEHHGARVATTIRFAHPAGPTEAGPEGPAGPGDAGARSGAR